MLLKDLYIVIQLILERMEILNQLMISGFKFYQFLLIFTNLGQLLFDVMVDIDMMLIDFPVFLLVNENLLLDLLNRSVF
jgi:RIO-like serine/threonine protein kinase